MNWEAISAIGEWIGAIAVIATLIYLAIQVRHTKHELKLLGMQTRGNTAIDVLAPIVNDPEIASLLLKMGHPRFGDFGLEAVEAQRIGAWCHMWMQTQQANHYLLPDGTHDELLQFWLSVPGCAEFWEKNKGAYDKDFVDRMERIKESMKSIEIDPDDLYAKKD